MIILITLAMAASVLLVLVVLAQNSKGGGLSSQFGGSGASNLIGVKKTGDLLERLTWAFAIAIMLLSLGTHLVGPSSGASDDILDKVRNERSTQPQSNPIQPLDNTAKPDSSK
jgi:preprotein translocase subunit SecG